MEVVMAWEDFVQREGIEIPEFEDDADLDFPQSNDVSFILAALIFHLQLQSFFSLLSFGGCS